MISNLKTETIQIKPVTQTISWQRDFTSDQLNSKVRKLVAQAFCEETFVRI